MKIIQLITINTVMNNIGLIVYGRFPTEKAYGSHLIDTANGFLQNGCKVTIFFSETSNKKTLMETPEDYYSSKKINFVKIKNYDFTKHTVYQLFPNILQKLLWTIGAYFWSKKLTLYIKNIDTLWSTNPNLLIRHTSTNKTIIYEKHGAGKFFQKFIVKKLAKYNNVFFVGTSKTSFEELSKLQRDRTVFLTNGVDLREYINTEKEEPNEKLNIGYIGMLETYGKDKGVKDAFMELKKIALEKECKLTLIGGPEVKVNEIIQEFNNTNIEIFHKYKIPKNEVAFYMKKLDIGIVPYPDELHMSKYASPMKIFEYAAANAVILSSDIQSNKELNDTGLGIVYFQAGNYKDFNEKVSNLIDDKKLRETLIENSKNNIEKYSIKNRIELLINFCVRSSIG